MRLKTISNSASKGAPRAFCFIWETISHSIGDPFPLGRIAVFFYFRLKRWGPDLSIRNRIVGFEGFGETLYLDWLFVFTSGPGSCIFLSPGRQIGPDLKD